MEHKLAILSLLLVIQLFSVGVESGAVRPCPRVGCTVQCPYGTVVDSNNCPTCTCKPNPRPGNCGYVCATQCPNGNVLDARGCPTCKCRPAQY